MRISIGFIVLIGILQTQVSDASLRCAHTPGQLKGLLSAGGDSTSLANSLLGRWSKSSDSEGFFFFLNKGSFFMAGNGPFGKDAQPLAICKKAGATHGEFVIVGTYKGRRQNIYVRYSGGKSFSISKPRTLKGYYALRDSNPNSVFKDSEYASLIRRSTN